jgi:hypothetical protein
MKRDVSDFETLLRELTRQVLKAVQHMGEVSNTLKAATRRLDDVRMGVSSSQHGPYCPHCGSQKGQCDQ